MHTLGKVSGSWRRLLCLGDRRHKHPTGEHDTRCADRSGAHTHGVAGTGGEEPSVTGPRCGSLSYQEEKCLSLRAAFLCRSGEGQAPMPTCREGRHHGVPGSVPWERDCGDTERDHRPPGGDRAVLRAPAEVEGCTFGCRCLGTGTQGGRIPGESRSPGPRISLARVRGP